MTKGFTRYKHHVEEGRTCPETETYGPNLESDEDIPGETSCVPSSWENGHPANGPDSCENHHTKWAHSVRACSTDPSILPFERDGKNATA